LEAEPPDIYEIEMAIQSMSSNKSPGVDNIPAEHYKKGGGLLTNKIQSDQWNMERRESAHRLENKYHNTNIQKEGRQTTMQKLQRNITPMHRI
jgi:chaperonin cofactor prefoldin